MCQAYEREQHSIIASEERASIQGFTAAINKKTKTDNPYPLTGQMYEHDAWNHGWGCYQEGIIPWGLEKLYRQESTIERAYHMCDRFRKNRYLSPVMRQILART